MGVNQITTACINHTYAGDKNGYARTDVKNMPVFMHRYVYAVRHGLSYDSLKGLVVRHTCDNSRCINPEHLVLGTAQDNVADRVNRGRSTRLFGVGHSNSKLTAEAVRDIRAEYRKGYTTQQQLADRYNVTVMSISNLLSGRTYKDVT